MSELSSDITVVGAGIAGLWTAKELIERGYSVNVIEKGAKLACGATTRNEGWLHAGTYHAVAIDDEADAERVTGRTIYGHDEIVDFVPESIEEHTSYAFTTTDALAEAALYRWGRFGVQSQEVPIRELADEGFDTNRIRAAFAVKDKSVNSRVICHKLGRFVVDNGGRILTEAHFIPNGEKRAEVVRDGEHYDIRSESFVIAAGTGTKQIFENITGKPFPMRYFKSHLLVAPRITDRNYFYIDPLEAGIMSHGDASIIGINREAIEVESHNYDTIPKTRQLLYDALGTMLPRARQLAPDTDIHGVACVKVDVIDEFMRANMIPQDLNIKVFEPANGYVGAIPGKMTEAPALARAAADHIEGRGTIRGVAGYTPFVSSRADLPLVNDRPADELIPIPTLRDAYLR